MRIGTVLSAEIFEEARKPAYKLSIDFGELGIKKSSAQITDRYTIKDLIGKQVVAVINFPPKQIANLMSECLILGGLNQEGVSLLSVDHQLPNGTKIG
jgi:tRNA-binding protein